MPINYIDIAFLCVLLLFISRGALRGFIAEVSGLLGLGLGIFLAYQYSAALTNLIAQYIAPQAAPTVAFVVLLLGGILLVGLVARVLQSILNIGFAGGLDHLAGALAGFAKGGIFCMVAAYAAIKLVPHLAEVRESLLIPYALDACRGLITSLNLSLPMP